MPELPEVEAVRRRLQPAMRGARIDRVVLRRANLRRPFPADFARRLEGRRVRSVERRGKYLLVRLDSGEALLMHLGMSGSFRIDRARRHRALADAATLAAACAGKRVALKVALLDQRVVAGLGNIYASEALHLAHLSPRRRSSTIATPAGRPRPHAVRLAAAVKSVLREAIARQA